MMLNQNEIKKFTISHNHFPIEFGVLFTIFPFVVIFFVRCGTYTNNNKKYNKYKKWCKKICNDLSIRRIGKFDPLMKRSHSLRFVFFFFSLFYIIKLYSIFLPACVCVLCVPSFVILYFLN